MAESEGQLGGMAEQDLRGLEKILLQTAAEFI